MTAYITATGAFLPGYPVPNDEIEDYIGKAGRASSDLKDVVLTNCGIKTRHYALDKKQQTVTLNAAMAANAVRNAAERAGLGPNEVDLLSAATRRRRAVQRAGGWFRASADLIRRGSRRRGGDRVAASPMSQSGDLDDR